MGMGEFTNFNLNKIETQAFVDLCLSSVLISNGLGATAMGGGAARNARSKGFLEKRVILDLE